MRPCFVLHHATICAYESEPGRNIVPEHETLRKLPLIVSKITPMMLPDLPLYKRPTNSPQKNAKSFLSLCRSRNALFTKLAETMR